MYRKRLFHLDWIFQFLMVRLKEPLRCQVQRNREISIPYGSIKSARAFHLSPEVDISIPYGSIKRPNAVDFGAQLTPFQFLMVRLKVLKRLLPLMALLPHFNSLWFD